MGDLDESPLFDNRQIKIIQGVLRGEIVQSINATEQLININHLIIKNIDIELKNTLVEKLNYYKKFFSVEAVINFLIIAFQHDSLDVAIEILDSSLYDKKGGSLETLLEILRETKEMPASWAVAIHAEVKDERHSAEKWKLPSGLNLDAMKNFK